MKNGIIGIFCSAHKVIDLKITNSLPIIALDAKSYLVIQNQKQDISGFQHFSIPSDLSIHLTKRPGGIEPTEHMFFDSPHLVSILNDSDFKYQSLFTYVSPPIDLIAPTQGIWHQAVIITPFPDDAYNVTKTRVFIDFFVHRENHFIDFSQIPFAADGMRLAYTRQGCSFGPFLFDKIQRKPRVISDLCFSIRYGYVEMAVEQNCFIYVQYPLRKKYDVK